MRIEPITGAMYPTCPHCRHMISDWYDLVEEESQTEVIECPKCSAEFRLTPRISYVFDSSPIPCKQEDHTWGTPSPYHVTLDILRRYNLENPGIWKNTTQPYTRYTQTCLVCGEERSKVVALNDPFEADIVEVDL